MAADRRAAQLGTASALAVLVLVGLPYAVSSPRAIAVYYGGGLVGPPLAGLFAAVAAIALLGAERGRTDPPLAAGVAVVLALLVAGLVVPWAVGVSPTLVAGLTSVAAFAWHRWLLALAALALLAGSGWYAWVVV